MEKKKKNSHSSREKDQITHKGKKIRLALDLSNIKKKSISVTVFSANQGFYILTKLFFRYLGCGKTVLNIQVLIENYTHDSFQMNP